MAPLLAVSVVLAPARAQMKDVTPYTAVVTAENASMRCGPGMYYRVAELPKGQTLKVDAEDGVWARVTYPTGMAAFVKIDSAKPGDASTVILTKPTELLAMNAAGGLDTSWKKLLDAPLPEGTSLTLIEVVKKNGADAGYKVAAPAAAKGFIELKALRRSGSGDAPAAAPTATATPAPVVKPTPAPSAPDTSLVEPIKTGTPAGADPQAAAKPTTDTPRPAPRRIGTIEELEAAFANVRKQPPEQAEYGALIAEFERAVEQAAAAPDGGMRKRQLERRRDFLKIQAEARDKALALERTKKELDENAGRVNQRLADLERQRVYTIIGLLVPSTVYDGKNLPLMFRLQAVGPTTAPTIGYLAPKPELQLETKLGMVVGVVGESTIERALSLNVIDPVRVDVLQAADGKDVTSPSGETPTAPSAAAPTNKDN